MKDEERNIVIEVLKRSNEEGIINAHEALKIVRGHIENECLECRGTGYVSYLFPKPGFPTSPDCSNSEWRKMKCNECNGIGILNAKKDT